MNVFLIHVGDDNFCRVLPKELDRLKSTSGRVKVMAFPPLGIQTLAPVLRQHGHQVRLFDTAHPQMKAEDIAQAADREHPDVFALSFLSTTTYPNVKKMAGRLKAGRPQTPIIVGGAFATLNADRIIGDCPDIDCVGVGEGEELLPDYLEHLHEPAAVAGLVWRQAGKTIQNVRRPLLQDLDRFLIPTGPACRLTISSRSRWMYRPCFRWICFARFKRRAVARTPASIAVFLLWVEAGGAPVLPGMSWENCRNSATWGIAPFT